MDARQEITFVGIGLNESHRRAVNDGLGVSLLPAGDLLHVDASTFVVHHPLFHVLVDTVGTAETPGGIVVFFTEENWGYGYTGPGIAPLNATIAPRRATRAYTDSGTDYDGFKGFHEIIVDTDIDRMTEAWTTVACYALNDPTCYATQQAAIDTYNATTPNAAFSLLIYEAQAAGSSDALAPHPNQSLGDRPAGPLADRRSPSGPSPTVPRSLPTAQPVPLDPPDGARPVREPAPDMRPQPAPRSVLSMTKQSADPRGEMTPLIVAITLSLALSLAAALYSRFRGQEDKVLSPSRVRLIELVAARGPLTVSDAARALGVDRKTVEHHARVLNRETRLQLDRSGPQPIVRLPGQPTSPPPTRKEMSSACRRLIEAILASGGSIERREIDRHVPGLPRRTRNHALRALVSEGFIEQVVRAEGHFVTLRTREPPSAMSNGSLEKA